MDINIIVSFVFGIVGVIAFIFAIKQSKKAKNILSGFHILHDKDLSSIFDEYVVKFLNKKLGIKETVDVDVDDIPF